MTWSQNIKVFKEKLNSYAGSFLRAGLSPEEEIDEIKWLLRVEGFYPELMN